MADLKTPPPAVVTCYALFLTAAAGLFHLVWTDVDSVSAIFTVAEMLQCLALLLLASQVISNGSADDISIRAVGMEAAALCCRLSSTLWLNGYLPVDVSGDYFYQSVDLVALATAGWILYQACSKKRSTCSAEADSFPVLPLVIASFVFAMLCHGNMNARPLFDTLWMAGLNLASVAVLPQLWLIMRTGGKVGPLMAHNIMAMGLSRALSGSFMWMARYDIMDDPMSGAVSVTVLAILGAHLLNLLLLADFGYMYVKAVMSQGLQCQIELDTCSTYV